MKIQEYRVSDTHSKPGILCTVMLPANCTIVKVGIQRSSHYIWAMSNSNESLVKRIFFYVHIGQEFPSDCSSYVGSYEVPVPGVSGSIITWHMFEFIA